jgi:hypothetical protein
MVGKMPSARIKIDETTAAALRRLVTAAKSDASTEEHRRITATITDGLPVYAGWGGTLVVTAEGEVLLHDSENGTVAVETDPRSRLFARVKAAQRFSELSALLPTRSEKSADCSLCNGEGRVFDLVDCGRCLSLGWIDPE